MSSDETVVRTGKENGFFTVRASLILPRPVEGVFPFFADAANLENITPPWLRFEVLTPSPVKMRAGCLIEYRLRLHGIAMRWQTVITCWEPPHRFIDEQQRGPYRTWIHEHLFEDLGPSCRMSDFVKYSVPGGTLVNMLFVRRNVRGIFEYRLEKLKELFR